MQWLTFEILERLTLRKLLRQSFERLLNSSMMYKYTVTKK